VKLVLVIPPCGFCWDRDAVFEVLTVWGCWASLCPGCTGRFDSGQAEPALLRAGAAVEPLLTAAEAGAYVDAQTWTFARTMPKWPHEYVLIWKSTAPWTQLRVLAFIRAVGEPRRWGRKTHHYWTHGEHEYWAMPPRETILNRRRLDWPS
jgi:hypothetical protein